MSQQGNGNSSGDGVLGKVVSGVESLAGAAMDRLKDKLKEQMDGLTDKLVDYAGGGGGPGKAALSKGMESLKEGKSPVGAAVGAVGEGGKEQVKQAFGKGGGGGDGGNGGDDDGEKDKNDFKATHIIETLEVGVPVWLAYNAWTQFKDFPSFMKKLEDVEQEEDGKVTWKGQVLWSHRRWESTIIEQVPDERIVWQSKGDKGSIDGTVTFHELAPDLTHILVVMQYNASGFVEKTANLWRAAGRRVRLELKHYVRHVMTDTLLHPEDVKGWRGEIRDGEVVKQHEDRQPEGEEQGGAGEQEAEEKEPSAQQGNEDGGPPPAKEGKEKAARLAVREGTVIVVTDQDGTSLAKYLTAQRDALLRTNPGVRSGDADAVHDMRVAIRRLRATARTFRSVLPAELTGETLQDDLRWFGGLLGAVRDTDVMAERLANAIAAEAPEMVVGPVAARIRQRLAATEAPARTALAVGLDSSRFANLLDTLDSLVDTRPPEVTDKRLRKLAGRAVRRADRRLDAAYRRRPDALSPDARDLALHEARKAFKRARYAVEVLRPFGGRRAKALVKRLKALQDLLGGYQDAVVTAKLLRDYGMRAYLDGENAFTYGLLLAREDAIGAAELSQVDRAWRRAGKPGMRAWLR